jgi:hypothetical protein
VLTGIDHLVIAVADPDAAVEAIAGRLGLAPGGGGRHPSLGTFNRLLWLGDSYLELIGIADRALAEQSWLGAPTVLALAAGGGLATWAVASDDLESDVADLRGRGSELSSPISGERTTPEGAFVRWRLSTSPSLGPASPPFLIEHDPTAAEWTPADRTARGATPIRLEGLEITVDDVAAAQLRFLRTVGLRFRPSLTGGGARDGEVGRQTVRLRPRRDATVAVATVLLRGREAAPAVFDLLGCRWRLERDRS